MTVLSRSEMRRRALQDPLKFVELIAPRLEKLEAALNFYALNGDDWVEQTNLMFDGVDGIASGRAYHEVLFNYGARARAALKSCEESDE